jgi:ankyrin repeat protein
MAVLPAAQLLSGGFDIEANDLDKEAALQWAAKNGYQEVVQLLIDKKAEITAEDKDGWTALHYAARYGREEVVRLLVNKEADIKAKSKTKQTALVIAAEYGHKAVVQLLLNKGADIAALDKEEWTALHFAARYGHEPVVRLLSDNKADTMAKSKAGKTALVIAAQYGQEAVVKLLLSIGADIAVGDKHQWTALHFAARYGQEGVARLLLDNKADIMAKSKAGKTALALAAQYEHRAVVQLLLSKRADIKAEDEDKDDDEDTDEYEDKDEDEDAWYSAMSPSLNSPQSGKPQASVQNIKPLHKIKISPPKSVQGPPLLNMDVDLQFDSDGSLHYCDRCTTMMTTTGLKEAQSAKGYKHSNGISECEKRARGGPSIPGCSFCKMILDEMRYPRSSSGPLNFFSKLNGTKVCRGEPDSDLAYFDSLSVGPLAGFSSGLTLSFIAFTSDGIVNYFFIVDDCIMNKKAEILPLR